MRLVPTKSWGARQKTLKLGELARSMTYRLSFSGIACAALFATPAYAQGQPVTSLGIDPLLVGVIGVGASAVAAVAVALAIRFARAARNASVNWSAKLSDMESKLEKADAVLAAHPGLVLVWEEDYRSIASGWGSPRILGGPAALASLMSLAKNDGDAEPASPVDRLLDALGELPLEEDGPSEDAVKLRDRVRELRAHGIAFSGCVYTSEGRAIEADGRVAGGQVALWLTDPAVRMAEQGSILGKVREKTVDLHGALSQLDRSPIPAWRRGADLRLTWVNAAYAEAVEVGTPAAAVRDQVELDAAAKRIAERAASERRAVEGRIIVNIKGQRRAFRIQEAPMHAAGDAAIAGCAVDITDLENARADLKRQIEANRRTLDQVPTATALFGAEQELVYCNNAFCALWKLDEAELSVSPSHGEILDRLRHAGRLPEQADYQSWKRRQLALYTENIAGSDAERDGAAPDEIWHLPDGRMLRVVRSRHPLGGVIVVFDDITERLRLEAMYNTQISVQRATLNNLAEGVATFAADGALKLYNEAFLKIWRLDETSLGARTQVGAVLDALTERVKTGGDLLGSIKRRATSMEPEDRTPIRDATVELFDGRTVAFGAEPLPDGATMAHFRDITDTREREKELRERNALLEQIDLQKAKFVDHVSYQLRTPLNTIIGFSEMVDGQMFGVLNDRQKDYIANVLSAAYTLKDLISDIMDLAALDAGKMTLEREDVNIRTLLSAAATYSALKAEDTKIGLKVDCPKDIGMIEADGRRLKQVLFNLLSNAFAFTRAGGTVTIGAERIPNLVRIWVADSGRGVSPEDQARAFDPFKSSGPSAGAGLGLTLVKRLVELHGGWVIMESSPGEGTRVTVFLPTAASTTTTPPPEMAEPEQALPDNRAKSTPPSRKTRRSAHNLSLVKAAE